MEVKSAEYVATYVDVNKCPDTFMPEYALIGRSNVGKSSLINYICNHKGLAKVSGTPGKTQTINYFVINNTWHLVDLPGYGYAKTSQANRAAYERMIQGYLANRETLQCVFLLIDSRLKPQNNDIAFANWLGAAGVPFVLVFTKADKPGKKLLQSNVAGFRNELLKHWEEVPQHFITSVEEKTGQDELLQFIGQVNQRLK